MKKEVKLLILAMGAVVAAGCGNGRLSPQALQHKLDSVNALEKARQLRLRGIKLEGTTPFQMFYDSLQIQALPVVYTEEYVKYLPDFRRVPTAIMSFLELEGRVAPRAVALPETLGTRLVLLAADLDDGQYELWLYSLDMESYPVDKLLLYSPPAPLEADGRRVLQEPYFSITSDYEINVLEYADASDRRGQLSTFIVDDSRQFVEKQPL